MPIKTRWELTRSNILAAQVPANTSSYTAIPHRVFLEEVSAELTNKGYLVVAEEYSSTKNYQVVTGSFTVRKASETSDTLPEMYPSLYFVNSYNKSRRAILHGGAKVLVCKNGMIGTVGLSKFMRKHSGNALEELREQMAVVIDNLDYEYQKLQTSVSEMKQIQLDKEVRAKLVGDMIINEDMLTATQIGILKHEIQYSEHFKDGSLWSFYNNCTEAFKETHPMYYDRQHIKLHAYLSDKFSLSTSRGLYGEALVQDDDSIPFLEAEEV